MSVTGILTIQTLNNDIEVVKNSSQYAALSCLMKKCLILVVIQV